MTLINKIILKISLVISGILFFSNSYAQYLPFWANERDLSEYSHYEPYLDIVEDFNNDNNTGATIESLDSLALKALNNKDYSQFLFLKNEAANFYLAQSRYDDGYTDLYKAMQVFSNNHDTLSIEYVASQRLLRKLLTRSSHESRNEGELFQSQLDILNALNIEGEPMRNTLIDYGLYLTRQKKTKEAINILYDARNYALKENDLSSLGVADYTIITNLPPVYDIQKTTMEVLKNDIRLFEQAKPSIPVLTYSAYFNYLVGERYYDYFEDYDQGIFYTKKAIACLDTLIEPAWNLKASSHSSLALMYADLKDTSQLWDNYNDTKIIADTKPMSDYNKSLAYVNIADAVVTVSEDSATMLLDSIKKQPGAQFFEDKIAEIEAKALIKSGEENGGIQLITEKFNESETIKGYRIPVISDSIDYMNQIHFFHLIEETIRNSDNVLADEKKPYVITNLILKQNQLFLNAIKKDIYGHELSSLTNKYHDFLMPALEYLLTSGEENSEEAIQLIFASKAIQLYNNLIKSQMQSQMDRNPRLLSQFLDISDDIQNVRNKLANTRTTDAQEKELKKELNTLLVDNMVLRYQMNEKQFETDEIQVPSLQEIQKKLNPGEGIIEYTMNDSVLIWTLITKSHSKTGIKYIKNLPGKISEEIHAIKTGRKPTDIGSILFSDIEAEILKLEHVTIIPDGELSYIPFEWMVLPKSQKRIIETLPVSYNYSTALWYMLKNEIISKRKRNILSVAPLFYDEDKNTDTEIHYSSNYRGSGNFQPLYHSKKEVNSIDSIFRANDSKTLSLLGTDASMRNTKEHLQHFDIIHLATHGLVNPEHPERSGLFLYPDNVSEEKILKDDNILTLGELMTIDLKADLVVLSACNTGKGRIAEGEGVIALPRGFILSGVPNVISTLWNVHDQKTMELMKAFYSYMLRGNSYAEALRLAKLDAIKKGFMPMDWAGIVLIGS